MARLSVPPSKRVTHEVTPPPPSDVSYDAEAATQQLWDEVRASASKLKSSSQPPSSNLPPSSAVLGANLLNAARIEYRHSSPVGTAPKSSNGRLSRVGLFTEPRRQNLARPRQRNVYEFPDESPEKMPFELHERVNRNVPMKIVKRKMTQNEDAVPSSEPAQPSSEGNAIEEPVSEDSQEPTNEPPMPSSPPRVARDSDNVDENGVQIVKALGNGTSRCAVASYRSDKPAGPRYEQCHNAGTHNTDDGPRCTRHVEKRGSLRCEYMLVHNGDPVQCRVAGVKGSTRCSKHTGMRAAGQEGAQKRKSVDNLETQGEASRSTKLRKTRSNPEVQISVRESRKERPARQKPALKQSQPRQEEEVTELIETGESVSPYNARRTSSKAKNSNEGSSRSSQGKLSKPKKSTAAVLASNKAKKLGGHAAKEDQTQFVDEEEEDEEDDRQEQEGSDDEEAAGKPTHVPRAVRHAFKYLDLEERPGQCKTELCLSIKSVCDKINHLLRNNDLSVEDIAENIDDVQGVLNEVRNTDEEDRVSTKADMYGYVFRSLTKVLRSLYRALAELDDDVTKSLDAMRIFAPLVHHILLVKDLMASWKVTVPQRYEGDRIIKDVDTHLIAPLRLVDDEFSKGLRQLESKEKAKQERVDIDRGIEEENEEMQRLKKSEAARQDRWVRWQKLHIERMACEPDPQMRVPLRIIKLEDLEETDANGVKFQRLPVFKDRETPPIRYPPTIVKLNSWSDEEETALLEGLEKFAGPDVFGKIFKAYCRPRNGGRLREFRVVDIVTKAAWIHTNFAKLHQEKGWEMPDWVRQIPVLP